MNSLKFYSSKEGRVLKMISLPQKKGLPSITRNSGLKKLNDEIYYSLRTPERILFKVNAARKSKVDDNTAKMQSIKWLGV